MIPEELKEKLIAEAKGVLQNEFTNPCHMCKQLLYESRRRSNIPMLIILTNNHGETKELQLDEIISYPWPV
ncbi:hypothetical protein HGA88_02900 [Candidatus Roizmanbacteria bacterium]|nr:hypothetical protein [Candidatus Roizmanbacteria bacterium]